MLMRFLSASRVNDACLIVPKRPPIMTSVRSDPITSGFGM